MKFIHAADIHLGCQPDRGFPWSRERSFDILAAFRDLILACKKEKPDLLLMAGDLFHRQPSTAELKEADALFSQIPEIPVVMIAGNHDCVRPGSSLERFSWSPNVTFLSGREPAVREFPDLGTVVHGDEAHIPIDREKLAASGFSYIALGHLHKPELDPAHRLAFSGSLSPIEMSETGSHGYVLGELNPDGGPGALKLSFVPLPSRSYIPCRVKVTEKTTAQSLLKTVSRFTEQYGASNIYRLTLTGKRDPGVTFREEELQAAGRIISFQDDTVPFYPVDRLLKEHRQDLIGEYIRAFLKEGTEEELTDPVRKTAFYYGLEALLSNFDPETGEVK